MRKVSENEKILLELEGLKRTKIDSLRITAQLNDAMIKILTQKIKREKKNLNKEKLIEELRRMTMVKK